MWVPILHFKLREAHTDNNVVWHVNYSPDVDVNFQIFLKVAALVRLKLLSVSADEHRCHVVGVRQLPVIVRFHCFGCLNETIDLLLGLSCLHVG